MSIVINDLQIERLAQQIAAAEGISVEDAVWESLVSLASRRGLAFDRQPLRERLAALAHEVDAIPAKIPPDNRTAEEILGYGERGLW